jgi:hypothetical protein
MGSGWDWLVKGGVKPEYVLIPTTTMSQSNRPEDLEIKASLVEEEKSTLVEADAKEERRLVTKLDRRILPIACLMYLFACELLDLGECTKAITDGLSRSRSLEPRQHPPSRTAAGYTRWRPYGREIRLGQLDFLLLVCKHTQPHFDLYMITSTSRSYA